MYARLVWDLIVNDIQIIVPWALCVDRYTDKAIHDTSDPKFRHNKSSLF